ncbi:MAG: S8 family serine peptidase [Clostridiales bacterium]|nr:S8 family serine peptidase [Clostridiales bacterium]
MIDGVVDYTNSDIEVVNADDYSVDAFYTDEYLSSINHGTHVAGIIGAEQNNNFGIDGMCSTAEIYSYNGINNSISYWIASLCRMIHYENVKAINVSMGCNTFLIISASMGDEFALNYYDNICGVFEAVLEKLIDSGDEFVIVQAAGNSAYSSQYKVFFECFGYGDKKILSCLDLLGLLDTKTGVADAKYVFYFSNIENEKVRERIIVVGSVNNYGEYSIFSNTGEAVDIAAPGEEIYSSVTYNSFELMSGTSMAAPFVTGTAAMLFALDDTLTGAEVKEILTSTYSATVSVDEFTYPILNAGNAVSYVYDLISAS